MVNARFKIGVCAIWLLLAGSVASAKEWRGIVPLKSTRADVERAFGIPKGKSDAISYYKLANEIVVFNFENGGCDSDIGKLGYGWNVPLGTVTSIGVIPRGLHRLEEYNSANKFKIDDAGAGIVYYTDQSAGLTVETFQNRVTLLEHYPQATQESVRCPRVTECCIDFFPKFDEYANLPFADEKARLDNFVFNLNAGFWRGTIQVVGPSKKDRQQRLKLAARAKRYLVRERGLESERLLIIDAGFNEVGLTRLTDRSIGGPGTRIYLYPRKDPENTRPVAPTTSRRKRRGKNF